MAENKQANTYYPSAAPMINNFLSMINPNYREPSYGPILAQPQNRAYNMLENMTINSYQKPSVHAEFFEQDGMYSIDSIELLATQVVALSSQVAATNIRNRPHFGAAVFYTEELSSMDEARSINNNRGYAGYRDNSYSNQYHPSLHNHENFLYASYSDEGNPSLEDLVGEFVMESSKRLEPSLDEGKPSLDDLFGEFATTFSNMMENNEQILDDLDLHMVDLGATMKYLEVQVYQLVTALCSNREHIVNDDNETIESTPAYEELFPNEHEEGMNGNG